MNQSRQDHYDTIVIGLGAMGSGIAYQLSRSGRRVLGLDRHRPPHVYGSSHGQTRVIRKAYGDDARYIPWIHRTFEGWRELERTSGETLLIETGFILMGAPESQLISTTLASAELHGIVFDILDSDEISQRWPAIRMDSEMCGVWARTGGILRVETCIETLLTAAVSSGAALQFDEPVEQWHAVDGGVEVRTSRGRYHGDHLVIAAGPWATSLLSDLNLPLWVERHVQLWFEPRAEAQRFAPQCCPIFAWQHRGTETFYGFPDLGQGIKVAHHHTGQQADPDKLSREIDEEDVSSVRQLLERFLPDANGRLLKHDVCMYTNTPDKNFIIDVHPDHPHVFIVGGCSGHGFKFAPAVGEIVTDLLAGNPLDGDLEMFRLKRLLR